MKRILKKSAVTFDEENSFWYDAGINLSSKVNVHKLSPERAVPPSYDRASPSLSSRLVLMFFNRSPPAPLSHTFHFATETKPTRFHGIDRWISRCHSERFRIVIDRSIVSVGHVEFLRESCHLAPVITIRTLISALTSSYVDPFTRRLKLHIREIRRWGKSGRTTFLSCHKDLGVILIFNFLRHINKLRK